MIYLMGCMAGSGGIGSNLLRRLSMMLRPRKVVGFTRVGNSTGQRRVGSSEICDEPGMRDTQGWGSANAAESDKNLKDNLGNLEKWPWASENSSSAKVAQNGMIVRWPPGEDDDGQDGSEQDKLERADEVFRKDHPFAY